MYSFFVLFFFIMSSYYLSVLNLFLLCISSFLSVGFFLTFSVGGEYNKVEKKKLEKTRNIPDLRHSYRLCRKFIQLDFGDS